MRPIIQIPPSGKYAVRMVVGGKLHTILIKRIKGDRGENYIPGPLSRFFKVPYMSFSIAIKKDEIVFVYDNRIMVDKLRKINRIWLGRIYLRGAYAGPFILKRL